MLSEEQHLLSTLAEECNEVAQRVSKALRFGLSEVQPGQMLDNSERITVELDDLFTMVEMLVSRGIIPQPCSTMKKRDQVLRFMEYARGQGALA